MPLTARSTEVILADYGRRNPCKFEHLHIGENLYVPDVGELECTDIQRGENEYDSYGDRTSDDELEAIFSDESLRLFRVTIQQSSYSDAISVIDVKHVVAKPIDRIAYIAVKN